MVRALLVSLVAAAALTAAPAAASATAPTTLIRTFMEMGTEFWAARGVPVCDNPVPHVTELPDEAAGLQAEGCQFWLSATLVRRAGRERWRRGQGGDSYRADLCTTVFHELGHTAGLQHTPTGLMSEIAPEPPGECVQWVKRQERRERHAAFERRLGVAHGGG